MLNIMFIALFMLSMDSEIKLIFLVHIYRTSLCTNLFLSNHNLQKCPTYITGEVKNGHIKVK